MKALGTIVLLITLTFNSLAQVLNNMDQGQSIQAKSISAPIADSIQAISLPELKIKANLFLLAPTIYLRGFPFYLGMNCNTYKVNNKNHLHYKAFEPHIYQQGDPINMIEFASYKEARKKYILMSLGGTSLLTIGIIGVAKETFGNLFSSNKINNDRLKSSILLFIGGGVLSSVGVFEHLKAGGKLRGVVKRYNYLNQQPKLGFGATPNGLGLKLNF
jgi:hypothetical protein